MDWCNVLNMWCQDIDDEIDDIGCDGKCWSCEYNDRHMVVKPMKGGAR